MENIKVEIITIGDELLYGQTLDTNSHWISAEMDKIGYKVVRRTTIGDDEQVILQTFAEAEHRAQLIIITGGLGPTNDDLTKPCLVKYFNTRLMMNPEALEDITALFKSKGREITELNRRQALFPETAKLIRNKNGTAPGIWFEKNNKVFVSMPGVPHEMISMMTHQVIPMLKKHFSSGIIFHKIIHTVGIGESWLADLIRSWEDQLPKHIRLAYLPSLGMVKLRLTGTGDHLEKLKQEVENQVERVKPLIEDYIYGYDAVKLEERIGQLLIEKNLTISFAESCSGGFLSHLITSIPRSSKYFKGSIISYDNEVKHQLLGVSKQTLLQYGAVSEQTVIEMAEQVRKLLNTDIGISVSGIAGPDGGTIEKPVGTVWLAVADGKNTITKKVNLGTDRVNNIILSSTNALNLLRQRLKSIL